ncbi:hypothetical protein [Photobacterium andalusiense]|uniref:HNH nuclease domain-containing protein n=1 Tax=Photobacterium andalusiense TaxID=2204296 RepID=A0A1Y6MCR3_9GAMM|nr:hypothetical protein [Photobacterium andalusiense]SMY34344.1 hypothetical protein PAND9192_01281 [Photobacterium andalusiense]
MTKLQAKVSSGDYKGTPLSPHKHKEDNRYVASLTRFQEDYVRVDTIEELATLVESGYGARMSNDTIPNAPSLIVSENISNSTVSSLKPFEHLPTSIRERDLESDSVAKVRKEQSYLRAHLLQGKKVAKCSLCGEEFPFDLLVAAHIKKRSKCKDYEKLDFDNIATLMCKTGCDDFFEKGYVVVISGEIVQAKRKGVTSRVQLLIDQLVGKVVPNWKGSEQYYEWHQKAHYKKKAKKI